MCNCDRQYLCIYIYAEMHFYKYNNNNNNNNSDNNNNTNNNNKVLENAFYNV